MKTYLKGIKTVAVIFLSLALFSCQDEQIEPIDNLSTESDELMLRGKGKPGGDDTTNGNIHYVVILTNTSSSSIDGSNLTSWEELSATCSTSQDLLWFDGSFEKGPKVTIDNIELFLQSIRLGGAGKIPSRHEITMHDGERNNYRGRFDIDPSVSLLYMKPYGADGDEVDYSGLEIIIGKRVRRGADIPIGKLYLGTIKLTPITTQ